MGAINASAAAGEIASNLVYRYCIITPCLLRYRLSRRLYSMSVLIHIEALIMSNAWLTEVIIIIDETSSSAAEKISRAIP